MSRTYVIVSLLLLVFFALPSKADVVDITLSANPQSITPELSAYIAAQQGGVPRVGFNAADIGQGSGDGLNEIVAFSFLYDPIVLPIASATLTLDLTKPSILDLSDHLLFADNNTPSFANDSMNPYYGNATLGSQGPGSSVVIELDLMNISTNLGFQGVFGSASLTHLLPDGELNVVYSDDAIVRSARLRIDVVPEPTTSVMVLVVISIVAPVLIARSRRRTV